MTGQIEFVRCGMDAHQEIEDSARQKTFDPIAHDLPFKTQSECVLRGLTTHGKQQAWQSSPHTKLPDTTNRNEHENDHKQLE